MSRCCAVFPAYVLVLFFVVYYLLVTVTAGLYTAAGLFVPNMVIGTRSLSLSLSQCLPANAVCVCVCVCVQALRWARLWECWCRCFRVRLALNWTE
jgi:H+/Cl- antiporter ClcA